MKSREVRSVRAVNLLSQNWKEIPLRRLTILFALVAVFGWDYSFAQGQNDYTMPASGVVTVAAEGGHIFQAKINGQGPFKLLFDTGSSNLLSASFARHLGLPLEGNVKIGAGGGTLEGQTAHVDTLQIGDLVLRNQTFYVIDVPWDPSDPQVGAIGYEVMMRLAVKIDFEEQKLTFYREPPFKYSGTGVELPLLLQDRIFEVDAKLDGVNGRFQLDTGNQFGFDLDPGFVKQNGMIKRLGARYHGYAGRGYGGPLPEAYYARVKTLRLGDTEVNDVVAYLHTRKPAAGELAGNIGQSILRQFNETFDAPRGKLYLEKNGNWGKRGVFNRAGIVIDPVEQGQRIMTVLPGGPGETAGLKAGDVITAIDGHVPEDDPNEPSFLQAEGTVVRLTVKKGDAVRKVDVKLKDLF